MSQAEQVAGPAVTGCDETSTPDNTVDVRPYLRNGFLNKLQQSKPALFGRCLVRTMDDCEVARRLALLDSQLKRLKAVGTKLRDRKDLSNKQRMRYEKLKLSYITRKEQRQAILDEQERRAAIQAQLPELSRQRSAEQVRKIEQRRKELWQASGLAGSTYSFDDIPLDSAYPQRAEMVKKAKEWVECFPAVGKGVAIYGHTGVTKTCLAKAMAKALNSKPEPISTLFIKCMQLGSVLDAEKRDQPEVTLMERAKSVEVVFIDDIEKALAGVSSLEAKKFIRELLDWIEDNHRIAIATSEFPLYPDEDYKDEKGKFLCHQNGVVEYVFGRMVSVFDWVELMGTNYRLVDQPESKVWWA